MRRKVTNFVLEIEVHAATCPGVWLCPDGDISVQLRLFGDAAETKRVEPVFPILYHEKFVFQKVFPDVYFLTELENALDKERLYVDLIQWSMSGPEIVLATFKSTLIDLLYPSTCKRKTTEADLLMDPTDAFPGIISPKIETSTKTTVEEIILTDSELLETSMLLNSSKYELERYVVPSIRDPIKRQRKVCHSRLVHEMKAGNCSVNLSQTLNESRIDKSRPSSPFSVKNFDTSVGTYESFLNSTRAPHRKKDVLNVTPAQWTSISPWSDESSVRHSSTVKKIRKKSKVRTGASPRRDRSSAVMNSTLNNEKMTPKIAIDPRRSVNDPEPHDTTSCLMCSQYNSFFEEDNGDVLKDT